ncbi:MAG: murein biosynthesis integral membrane protein MurJ [Phycisphaerae bacterium]|jgi:putative peptidoglycan lipid II flippase
MDSKAQSEHKEREHFFNAAKVVAGITLISRIFGFFRDMGIVSLGATRYNDAFGLAFKIPNLFRRLFGEGALASAFVPVFTEVHEKDGIEKARLLLANAFAILAVFLAALLVIGELIFFLYSLVPGPKDREFLMLLVIIMYPYMFTVCLLALCSAALNARGRFVFSAFAPIIFNIFGITAAWWLAPLLKENLQHQLVLVAFSVVIAGVVQLAAVLWLLKRVGLFLRPRLKPVEPGIWPILKLITPMLIGLGFLQFSEFFQDIIAWNLTVTEESASLNLFGWIIPCPLTAGVIVRVGAARAFYQFPMGVLAISLGVAVFPLLSRYASRGDIPNLRDSVNRAIRLSLMEGLATGVGLFMLAEPIMMIYARRRFTVDDAMQAAFVLKMYVLGMWAYCSYQILARAFYACKDTKTPLKVSCVLAVVNLILLLSFIWLPGVGPGAFGLSTSITFAINVMVLIYILRKRLGLIGGRKIAASLVRAVIACAAMAGAVHFLKGYMEDMNNLVLLGVCVPAGAIVFIFVLWLLKASELGELMGREKLDSRPQ